MTRITYGPCAQGTYVIADSIQGEGHQWPDANRLNQSDEVWAFFKQFSLKGTVTSVHQQTVALTGQPITASYLSGIVHLQGVGDNCHVKVINTKGVTVATESAVQQQFNFKNRPSGVYLIKVFENNRPVTMKMVIP